MGEIWEDYYNHFGYLSKTDIRDGCHPWVMDWGDQRDHAIVLVHGLTDSPYFMRAIGRYFHEKLEFNVFIPLLQGHGLKEPKGMKGVSLEEWKRNVDLAIKTAKERGKKVSIGGLSTGGAMSVYMAMSNSGDLNGGVFLFSAALDIAGKTGNVLERLLRTPVANILDFVEDRWGKPLKGDNPYRYSRMDKGGAQQLSRLIRDVENLTGRIGQKSPLYQPLFVVHSECDRAADIQGVEELIAKADASKSEFFRIGRHFNIPHASVVLQEPVVAKNGSPLEPENPFFDRMMSSVEEFVQEHLAI